MPDQPVITEPKPLPLDYHRPHRDFTHDLNRRFREAFTREITNAGNAITSRMRQPSSLVMESWCEPPST